MNQNLRLGLLVSTIALAGCAARRLPIQTVHWTMARQPTIPEADYRRIVEWLARAGYDTTQIQRVPQRWESAQAAN
jgi:hypothetical protein